MPAEVRTLFPALFKMVKSKIKIDKQMSRKTSSELVETIMKAKKNGKWIKIAGMISGPRRKQAGKNLDEIDRETKEGDTVIIPGKVLGQGEVSKKIRVAALYFSKSAREKLKNKKCEIVSIAEEIKVNPKAEGLKVLK